MWALQRYTYIPARPAPPLNTWTTLVQRLEQEGEEVPIGTVEGLSRGWLLSREFYLLAGVLLLIGMTFCSCRPRSLSVAWRTLASPLSLLACWLETIRWQMWSSTRSPIAGLEIWSPMPTGENSGWMRASPCMPRGGSPQQSMVSHLSRFHGYTIPTVVQAEPSHTSIQDLEIWDSLSENDYVNTWKRNGLVYCWKVTSWRNWLDHFFVCGWWFEILLYFANIWFATRDCVVEETCEFGRLNVLLKPIVLLKQMKILSVVTQKTHEI